jgi:hypothetical protein
MDWHSIWTGFYSNGLWRIFELIVVVCGGAVLTYLRKHGSVWAAPLLYGFVGSGVILGCFILFSVQSTVSSAFPSDTNRENVRNSSGPAKVVSQKSLRILGLGLDIG